MNPFEAELARRQQTGNPFAAELARRSAPAQQPANMPANMLQLRALEEGRPMPPANALSATGEAAAAMLGGLADPQRGAVAAQLRAAEEGRPGAVMPTQEEVAPLNRETVSSALEGAVQGVMPSVGAALEYPIQAALRYLGRGARAIPEAQIVMAEQLARQAATGIKDTRSAARKIAMELAKSAGMGATAGTASSTFLGPLGPLTGAGAAIVSTVLRLPPATAELLANHPKFAKWALSTGVSATGAGAKLGALTALAATEGGDVAAAIGRFINEYDKVAAEPQRGEAMVGAVGGAAAPVDPAILAQRLRGN